jgi:hypothetical protein
VGEAQGWLVMPLKLVHLRLGVIGHVLADGEAHVYTPAQERLPARLVLALRRAPSRVREGDLCEVAVQESDTLPLIACLHNLAGRPGVSAVDRDRFLQAVAAVVSAPARRNGHRARRQINATRRSGSVVRGDRRRGERRSRS